jgi:hypothetical protein
MSDHVQGYQNEWLFTLGSFMAEATQINGLFFQNVLSTLDKNGLGYMGYIMGGLFTNSSGHPAHVPTMASAKWDKKSSGQ